LNTHHTTNTIKPPSNLDEKQWQRVNLLEQVMIHKFRVIWSKFWQFWAFWLYALPLKPNAPRLLYALHQCIFALRNVAQCTAPSNPVLNTFSRRRLEAFLVSKLGTG